VPASPIVPLPDRVVRAPIRTAELRALGVSRREVDGPLWRPVAHGVRGWNGLDPSDPDVRIRTLVESQPAGIVLGGWMALRASGLAVMDGRTGRDAERLLPGLVHVGPAGRTRPRPLLHVDRGELDQDEIVEIHGLRVLSPTAAVVGIAQRYGVEEGLVAADAALRAGLTDRPSLRAYVAKQPGARGVRAARAVVGLTDPRAVSPPESRLRYVWVVEAGLPVPLVNPTVLDLDGFVAGEPDLLDQEAAFAGEYDGAQHRALKQHTDDNSREEALEGLNLTIGRVTSIDLWPGRSGLVRRLLTGHRRGLARDRRQDRFEIQVRSRDWAA
jgi:hypothetical protein